MFGRSNKRRQPVGGTKVTTTITQEDLHEIVPPPLLVSLSNPDDASSDDSYTDDTESPSKKGKKGHRRSCLDQVRLCLVTGRLNRLAVHIILLVGIGSGTYLASNLVVGLLVNFRGVQLDIATRDAQVLQHAGYTPKPRMVGYFFDGIDSPRSFTHRVQRLIPPRHHDEWVQMLKQRLEHMEVVEDDQDHPETSNTNDDEPPRLLLPLRYPMSDPDLQEDIETGSEYYEDEKPDITPNPEQCTPQYAWQTDNPVVCNVVHENTMSTDRMNWQYDRTTHHGHHDHHHHYHSHQQEGYGSYQLRRRRLQDSNLVASAIPEHYRYLAHGYWRDTWMMQSPSPPHHREDTSPRPTNEMVAFKTIRYKHDTTEYILDKQRRDAVTSDRITSSRQAIHMYAYCGSSALYEYAPGGDLENLMDKFDHGTDDDQAEAPVRFIDYYPIEERYILAYNVTAALTDLHTTEGSDRPTGIVHGDFKADQFVAVTPATVDLTDTENPHSHKLPHFKLGDFNLARMVYWNRRGHHPCVIEPDGNGGPFRAPEEYAQEHGRTEKVDTYSLGNLLYTILTGHWPFDDVDSDDGMSAVKNLVKRGHRPHINIDSNIRQSTNPQVRALVRAIDMCWEQDPHDRASAQEVLDALEAELL